MNSLRVVVVIGLACAAFGRAEAQNGMCPPPAEGVPFDPGPPQWRSWSTGSSGPHVEPAYDDPRWRGATAVAYNSALGSANPPVQFRSIWSNEGGKNYVYAQWIVRVGIFGQPTQGLDLFVGFQRPDEANLPADHQRASMVRIHIAGTPDVTASGNPSMCPSGACPDSTDNYRTYDSIQATGPTGPGPTGDGTPDVGPCGTPPLSITGDGLHFRQRPTDVGWINESVRVTRGTCSATSCDYWVVSLRIPVADRVPGNLSGPPAGDDVFATGIETGSKLWYQLNLPMGASAAVLDAWPRYTAPVGPPAGENPICFVASPVSEEYYQRDLDDQAAWAPLTLWNGDTGSRPSTCFTGIALTPDHVGVIPRPLTDPAPADGVVLTTSLGQEVKAYVPGGAARSTNLVVARPINNGANVTTKLRARFRLAQWGAQPASSNAVWGDITPDPTGVCAAGSPSPTTCNDVTINNGNRQLLKFDYTLGGPDGSFTQAEAEQFCRYAITPPAGFVCFDNCSLPGRTCNTAAPTWEDCGVRTDPSAGPSGAACLTKLWFDQCVFVDMTSDSDANFENQSVYRNLLIQGMSETLREAVISTAGLTPVGGERIEDIYLVVMPRNMPTSVPDGTNGLSFVQGNTKKLRDKMIAPYAKAYARLTPVQRDEMAARIAHSHRDEGGIGPEVIAWNGQDIPPNPDLPAARLMYPRDRQVLQVLDRLSQSDGREFGGESYGAAGLTRAVVDVLDDVTATSVVPTLDVYAFRATAGLILPLTSFTLVVHHEGPLFGLSWEIDGAHRLGPNLFRLAVPNGDAKKIRIRAMAKERPNQPQVAGDPYWPDGKGGPVCSGCCCGKSGATSPTAMVGNAIPMGLAAVFFGGMGARRRRKKRQDAARPGAEPPA